MSKARSLFMETTSIPAEKTAGEIVALLASSGARQIMMEYSDGQKLVGIRFTLEVSPGVIRAFKLPARIEPIVRLLNGRRKYTYDRANKLPQDTAQAERVAWRQLFRWCQAQLAMIDTGMVEAAEVFLPYLQDRSGNTLFEIMKTSGMKMLSAGHEDALEP